MDGSYCIHMDCMLIIELSTRNISWDVYSLPLTDEVHDLLDGSTIFFYSDGYCQVPVHFEDQEKTAVAQDQVWAVA